jgi:hypothetical protein
MATKRSATSTSDGGGRLVHTGAGRTRECTCMCTGYVSVKEGI